MDTVLPYIQARLNNHYAYCTIPYSDNCSLEACVYAIITEQIANQVVYHSHEIIRAFSEQFSHPIPSGIVSIRSSSVVDALIESFDLLKREK